MNQILLIALEHRHITIVESYQPLMDDAWHKWLPGESLANTKQPEVSAGNGNTLPQNVMLINTLQTLS